MFLEIHTTHKNFPFNFHFSSFKSHKISLSINSDPHFSSSPLKFLIDKHSTMIMSEITSQNNAENLQTMLWVYLCNKISSTKKRKKNENVSHVCIKTELTAHNCSSLSSHSSHIMSLIRIAFSLNKIIFHSFIELRSL